MLFGCKLRWTQKFPGTKQKAKLVKSTAVMMLVRQALCPRRQGLAPGTACTVTGTGFVPTDCIAPSSYSRMEACLFISIDERLHLPALSVPPTSSRSSASSVGGGIHHWEDRSREEACPELFEQEISASWHPDWGAVSSRYPVPLTTRTSHPMGGGTVREGSEWDPGQGLWDQV